MISLIMSREDWRTGSIPELPLLRMQKFKAKKGASMATAITDLRKLNRLSQSHSRFTGLCIGKQTAGEAEKHHISVKTAGKAAIDALVELALEK